MTHQTHTIDPSLWQNPPGRALDCPTEPLKIGFQQPNNCKLAQNWGKWEAPVGCPVYQNDQCQSGEAMLQDTNTMLSYCIPNPQWNQPTFRKGTRGFIGGIVKYE